MKLSKDQFIFWGLAAHLLAAIFTIGAHQCDEIFQIYEFAGYKLGLNTAAELPWEFAEKMRPGIQPFLVYVITRLLNGVSLTNPFTISLIIRSLQAVFTFIVMLRFLKLMEKDMRSQKHIAWLYGFSLLFWCIPYFHARFSSENFSATLFLLGFVILLGTLKKQLSALSFFVAGLLFGLAFECRFQISFMIVGLFLWLLFIRKAPFQYIFLCGCGLIAALGIGLLADHWLYGTWTLSWWNYLDLNLFQDKASAFGREPFYFFISEALLQLIPPFSLLIVFCIVGFWIRFKNHVLTWITLPFILLHFFVAHKEFRFLFPVLNFVPFMILYYLQSIENYPNRFITFIKTKGFLRVAVIVNVLLLVYYSFKPADNTAPILKKVYELADNKPAVFLYEASNPYTSNASLNYFRSPLVTTINLKKDSSVLHKSDHIYFFMENFSGPQVLVRKNLVFIKQYSSFPLWFSYLNFNGWVERSDPFCIYKIAS